MRETGRVEAFSDGVIAIAITLLVLEIKVPKADGSGPLLGRLAALWPSFAAFATSFFSILVMWVNHHRVFSLVRTIDYPFLYWNGFLLAAITFVPFPTAIVAEYLLQPDAKAAALFYCGAHVLLAIAYGGLWNHLLRRPWLFDPDADPAEIEAISSQYRFGPLMYLVALLAAFVSPFASLGLCFVLALFFAVAGRPCGEAP